MHENDANVVIKSWSITTASDREIRHFDLLVAELQIRETKVTCPLTLTLAASDSTWALEAGDCYVDLVFMANCD